MTPAEIQAAIDSAREYMDIAAILKAEEGRDPDVDPAIQRVMAEGLLALAERCGELEKLVEQACQQIEACAVGHLRSEQARNAVLTVASVIREKATLTQKAHP